MGDWEWRVCTGCDGQEPCVVEGCTNGYVHVVHVDEREHGGEG